jgi:hypothetical protein
MKPSEELKREAGPTIPVFVVYPVGVIFLHTSSCKTFAAVSAHIQHELCVGQFALRVWAEDRGGWWLATEAGAMALHDKLVGELVTAAECQGR